MYIADIALPILSLFFYVWFRKKDVRKFECFLSLATAGIGALYLFLSSDWVFGPGYYARFIMAAVYLYLLARSIFIFRKEPFAISKKIKHLIIPLFCILSGVFLTVQIITYLSGYSYKETAVKLSFPFKDGVYEVFWGGNGENSPLMNYHYSFEPFVANGLNESMQFATDIVKLNALGRDRKGMNPTELEKFEIFGEKIYSPCDGKIIDIQSGWKDTKIGDTDVPFNTGNTIIIETGDVYVLLAHIKDGSILVNIGDSVKQGQPLAEAGSSGLSSGIPHLHMQVMKGAYWGAEGLPIDFDSRFPVKNSIFIR